MKTAILIDGAYYRKLALRNAGQKCPKERAEELIKYCKYHLKNKNSFIYANGKRYFAKNELYRIFYYDCEPSDKKIFHPLKDSSVDLSKQPTYQWTMKFFEELKKKTCIEIRFFIGRRSCLYFETGYCKKTF